jgi:hypothetical protein
MTFIVVSSGVQVGHSSIIEAEAIADWI